MLNHLFLPDSVKERLLHRLILVCIYSGCIGLGIRKRIAENHNLIHSISETQKNFCVEYNENFEYFSLIKEYAYSFYVFFENINTCLNIDNISASKDYEINIHLCFSNFFVVTGSNLEKLFFIQNLNRKFMNLIRNNRIVSKHLFFAESWLEDHDIFFEDLHDAVEDVFEGQNHVFSKEILPWIGCDYTHCLMRNRIQSCKHFKLSDIYFRTTNGKNSYFVNE